ncbi:IclR family transcriptional regulator [Novosphingobium cyanobacteriorum]|uniref:Helix-turn-helix domain-containing protein n=1 Tax=Novosphingobium cyanobacteriorum TaxID=3024215 RepID=A0ABT6CKZ5_9SPHN|nr:helix-turn-helix domain-containing protein [Novosphingobium cyanobacteriorum]MDF8334599.1 helix-turn-helix domain-containing protein [Novosphingobium cyanobacteriorum]
MQLTRLSRALGEVRVAGCEDEETDRVVKSAGRVLRILELFDVLKREALVSEVSELLEFPQSSTSLLLRSMVILGYLYYNPDTRAFGPTTRVALLGSWINGPMISDGTLSRLIDAVNRRTGQAVVLAVRNRIWSEYIHVAQATDPLRLFVVKGSRRPLVSSGTGISLLTDLPDSDIKRIALHHNAESKDNVCLASVLEWVNIARERGWAASYDLVTPGGGMIAMRLPQFDNEERIALGIAGLTNVLRDNEANFVAIMQEEIAINFNEARVPAPELIRA